MEPVNYKKKYIHGIITGLAELVAYILLCRFDKEFDDLNSAMHIIFCTALVIAWNLKFVSRYTKRYPKAKYSDYRIPLSEPNCPEINICVFNLYKWLLIVPIGGIIGFFIKAAK